MSEREQLQAKLEKTFANRDLIWFSGHGFDAKPLLQFCGLHSVFSLVCPLNSPAVPQEFCIEQIEGRRDSARFDLDGPPEPGLAELRSSLRNALSRPSILFTNQPSRFVISCVYPNLATAEYLGLAYEQLNLFEQKTWVETQLGKAGVSVMPWQYVAEGDLAAIERALGAGPVVTRRNESRGGSGFQLLEEMPLPEGKPRRNRDGLFAIAPYLKDSLPLNVNACVFPDGSVTLHSPSVQLIGIEECTSRPFGYAGNDFAAIRQLEDRFLDQLEAMVLQVGRWLHRQGFLGAFGVDALLDGDQLYFVELNPRFQGSTLISTELDALLGLPDIYLDHAAAFQSQAPLPRLSMRDMAHEQPQIAHVVSTNQQDSPVQITGAVESLTGVEVSELPARQVAVAPGAYLFTMKARHQVTSDGRHLDAAFAAQFTKMKARFSAEQLPSAEL